VAAHNPSIEKCTRGLSAVSSSGRSRPRDALARRFVGRNLAPDAERENWLVHWARETFASRLGLVTRQLANSPFLAGDAFTAADISVTYALELAHRHSAFTLGASERAYVASTTGRDAYKRAMEVCQATKAWAAEVTSRENARPREV
jgi:glutathione S-transferase